MNELEKLANDDEIKGLLAKTKPAPVASLGLIKIEADLSFGSYYFYFKNEEQVENCIFLTPYVSDIYFVLDFLWKLKDTKMPICTLIEDEGQNGIFYAEPINDKQVHFIVADDYELYKRFCKYDERYSFADAHICLDIIMNKERLIKQFYSKLWKEIKDWKSTQYVPWGNKIDKRCEELIYKLNAYLNIVC